jgi:hypothetical protein
MPESEIIFNVVESPDGGFEARALGQSSFTEAESLSDLEVMVREAVECHFDNDDERPKVIRLHFVKDLVISA